jgi:hypothetical protein
MQGTEYIFLFLVQRQLSLMVRVSFLAMVQLLLDQVMPMGSPWDCWSMNLTVSYLGAVAQASYLFPLPDKCCTWRALAIKYTLYEQNKTGNGDLFDVGNRNSNLRIGP